MTIIDKIIFDKEWNRAMLQIDKMSFGKRDDISFESLHGYSHAMAVACNTVNILKQLGSNEHEVLLGEICGLVHDIGLVGGKDNHAKRGANLARIFLNRISSESDYLSNDDIELIVHAVSAHSNGEEINNNLDLALLVADKLYMTRDQLVAIDGDLSRELNKVQESSVIIDDDSFTLSYKVDNDFDKQAIKCYEKMVTIPQKAAKHLGLNFKFIINDEEVGTEFLK